MAAAHHKVDLDEVFEFELQPLKVQSRRMVLEMIFRNLLDNAIKYGGTPPLVHVSLQKSDRNQIIVRVTDSGEGVPSDQRNKIFKIFYRGGNELERRSTGTGLGLYIVRTLVYLLKGRVFVHSRLEENGSVFEVQLPGSLLA